MGINTANTVFFDGVCNLCNGFVRFIRKHGKGKNFHFVSLQSETAAAVLRKQHGENFPDSVVYIDENGKTYTESNAILEIFKRLDRPYSFLYLFRKIPARVRNRLYRFIATYRYHILGKSKTCRCDFSGETGISSQIQKPAP